MKRTIAIPTMDGKSCAHFGHCHAFAVVEVVNSQAGPVQLLEPPVHQPGTYPRFLAELGVDTVLAGGMGHKAQELFRANNIEVVLGVGDEEPGLLVSLFLADDVKPGDNLCNHDSPDHESCGH